MFGLQATWTPDETLFFWSPNFPIDKAIEQDFPGLQEIDPGPKNRTLALPQEGIRRRRVSGFEVDIRLILPHLTAVEDGSNLSDSMKCWIHAAKFGLELAARQRVVPSVRNGNAQWRALISRRADRERFDRLVAALPPASRAIPTSELGRGAIRLHSGGAAMRGFVDRVVDCIYRCGTHPGAARGWSLEFAEALRGPDAEFLPRDARYQGVPAMLASWSSETERLGLRVRFALSLPEKSDQFPLQVTLHPTGRPDACIELGQAWAGGVALDIGGREFQHPAHAVVRGLARASRIFAPIEKALAGRKPKNICLSPQETWDFISNGVRNLRDAGFETDLPEEFAAAGKRRIRAQMHLKVAVDEEGRIDLSRLLDFQWEVVLGDLVLTGQEFAELMTSNAPVALFRGDWVLLDPEELERLPDGLPHAGTLAAAEALRAALTGFHNGVPVVVDERLALVLQALREPPDREPPSAMQGTLRPYQAKGFSWLATLGELGLGCCLADDMGLGKTIQLIAHLLARKEAGRTKPSLVVCPTSVLGNWERELSRFAPSLEVHRYHGLNRSWEEVGDADVVLTTYGLLVRDRDDLSEQCFDVLALDEAQAIKNPDSQRARAACMMRAAHRVAMSGTPVENRLDELWSIMHFIVPGILGKRGAFRRNVAIPVERFGDQNVSRQLKRGIAPFLLRRLKSDPNIVDDLPEKIERHEYTSLTPEQAALYTQVTEEAMASLTDASEMERRGRVLALLTALKQICNHPAQYLKQESPIIGRSGKLDRVVEIIEALLDVGESALIFTQYRRMGTMLQRHLGQLFDEDIPFLHGGTPPQRRDDMVDAFQSENGVPLLIVSLRAGGTGLNLTRATRVIHFDRWWNPAVEDQATDRAYRIGQRRNVQVHKLVCQGTLEERIDRMLVEKRALAESVVGSGERWVTELDDEALRTLVTLGDDAVVEG